MTNPVGKKEVKHTEGSWKIEEGCEPTPSSYKKHKNKIILGLALLALASLAAGGALFYFKVNTIAAGSMMGFGGLCIVANVLILMRSKKNYTVVTWNVGTMQDYENMCFIKKEMDKHGDLSKAIDNLLKPGNKIELSKEELLNRTEMFRQAFLEFERPDIICLQEVVDIPNFKEILPSDYSYFTFEDLNQTNCTIAWNPQVFYFNGNAEIHYETIEYIPSKSAAPDTMVLLEDADGTTVCVCSAHLRGFDLAKETEDTNKTKAGDNQARYNLATMKQVSADIYVFAGDFNTTWKEYPQRAKIIEEQGFTTDKTEDSPTIYDANLKDSNFQPIPTRLDHILASKNVDVKYMPLKNHTLGNLGRPSDHLPVKATLSISPFKAFTNLFRRKTFS